MHLVAFAILLFFLTPGVSSTSSDWLNFTDQFVVLPTSKARAFERASAAAMDNLRNALGFQVNHLRSSGTSGAEVLGIDREVDLVAAREIADRISTILGEKVEPDLRVRHAITPNDPLYHQQWHYFEPFGGIEVEAAWDNFIGGLSSWDKEAGHGSVVAVLDTGYRPHEDLAANILPGYDMISDTFTSNDGDGRDPDAKDPGDWVLPGDCSPTSAEESSSWHGTHVAGTIAAVANNSTGVAGIAPGAKVLPVRVLGRCGGYSSDIADAIIWSAGLNIIGLPINTNKAQVINLSLSGVGPCSSFLQDAIDAAVGEGVTVVAAAGNDDAAASGYFPANCRSVITVAAIGRNADRAYYSNFGNAVDIAAPGGDCLENGGVSSDMVLSTHNAGVRTPSTDNYAFLQGTSMATPHVAGTVALMYSANPELDPSAVRYAVQASAKTFPSGSSCSADTCGAGIVDAAAAVETALLQSPSSCNEPLIDRTVENGVFLWQECPGGVPNGHWTVRVLSGGNTSTSVYEGQISSTAGFSEAATAFSLEGNDLLVMTQSKITFSLRVINTGWDGFEFTASPIGKTCFELTAPGQQVFVGRNKVPTQTSFDLATLNPCNASPATNTCGTPVYDKATETAAFVYNDCGTDNWHVRVTAGGQSVSYVGTLTATSGFDSMTAFSYEPNDALPPDFVMNVGGPGQDGLDFGISTGTACFALDTLGVPVYGGANRVSLGNSVRLPDFGSCDSGGFILSADDVSVTEGDTGTVSAQFTVNLSPAPEAGDGVVVSYQTQDGSATVADGDYAATSGTLTFTKGQTQKTVAVSVSGDTYTEGNETFSLKLSGADTNNLTATAMIVGDDGGTLPACGTPVYDKATETGVFLWNECDTNNWHMRVTAGGQSVSYVGTLTATTGFDSITAFSFEAGDVLPPNFVMNVGGPGQDGLDFSFSAGMACFTLDTLGVPVYGGANRVPVGNSVQLPDFGTCSP